MAEQSSCSNWFSKGGFQMTIGRSNSRQRPRRGRFTPAYCPTPYHRSSIPLLQSGTPGQSEELARYYREEIDPFSTSLTTRLAATHEDGASVRGRASAGVSAAGDQLRQDVRACALVISCARAKKCVRGFYPRYIPSTTRRRARPTRPGAVACRSSQSADCSVAVNQIWQHLFGADWFRRR